MARRIRDAFAFIPAAGRVEARGSEPVITADADRPPTPKEIAAFRKSQSRQPGRRSLHYGIARDPPPPDMRFGRRCEYNVSVGDCLYDNTAIGVAAVANEQAERVYASRLREPLGHTPHLYKLPEAALQPTFVFGNKSNKSERAKDVIYGAGLAATEAATESEKAQPVGVTRDRKYDWASVNIDPTKFRFGRSTASNVSDVPIKPTVIAPLLPSQRAAPLTAGFAKFDKPYTPTTSSFALVDIGDAREDGLGHPYCPSATLRKLRAQSSTPVDNNRVFGVPTVRTDVPRPKEVRFANANNYGDDATASMLLNPASATGAFAIDDRDYDKELKVEAANRIALASGVPQDQLESVVSKAKSLGNGSVTARSLRRALMDGGY